MAKQQPGRYGIEDAIAAASTSVSYWKTLLGLRKNPTRVALVGSTLELTRYAFEPASVFPSGTVAPADIAEVNLDHPSQVRLKSGEILFVPHDGKEVLLAFVNRHDVPTQRRRSVWSALLDPFLDTWFEQEHIDRQFAWFASLGLDRGTVDRWRREVAAAMIAYNFGAMVWEWVDLDLYDALVAQHAHLNRADFADFYARAMRLTALDPVSTYGGSPVASLEGGLDSVLGSWLPRDAGRVETVKQSILAELRGLYSQPHRHYHVMNHIEHCLRELNDTWDHAVHLEEVRWALLFHDAVYDPRRNDNELRSAAWACRVMEDLGRPREERARVQSLILATAHAGEPRTADEALLLDIDLSILGADETAFDEYDRAIRAEYEWVPEDRYREARAAVLRSFLDRERIYYTALHRRRLEARARTNLQRALARL